MEPMKYLKKVNSDILALVFAGIILGLSLSPQSARLGAPHQDLLHHLLAYGLLTGTAIFRRRDVQGTLLILAAIIVYGGVIEIIQPMAGRVGDFRDFAANLAGVTLGLILMTTVKRLVKSR
jgi:VanZ family protein